MSKLAKHYPLNVHWKFIFALILVYWRDLSKNVAFSYVNVKH